ncbi:MAG TPA: hypothetical protein VF318_08310, partial [Dehalococcoidales bacterium]
MAPVSTYQFKSVADSDPRAAYLPIIFTPHPVIGMSFEALDRYIVGNDPATGRPVIDEIIEVLTQPLNARKSAPESIHVVKTGAPEALLGPDTEDNLQQLFYSRGWTDGLPIILP